jgi:hypothetical protein
MAKVTAQEIRAAASFIMRMFQGQTNQAAQRREQVRAATGSDR